jgi:hypothetical protein
VLVSYKPSLPDSKGMRRTWSRGIFENKYLTTVLKDNVTGTSMNQCCSVNRGLDYPSIISWLSCPLIFRVGLHEDIISHSPFETTPSVAELNSSRQDRKWFQAFIWTVLYLSPGSRSITTQPLETLLLICVRKLVVFDMPANKCLPQLSSLYPLC